MFSSTTYRERRAQLAQSMSGGLLFFPGVNEQPMNYKANTLPYRQDSSFLYYFGHAEPNMAGIIDVDNNRSILFGYDYTIEDIIWTGPQPTVAQKATAIGAEKSMPIADLIAFLQNADRAGRVIHFLPPFLSDHVILLQKIFAREIAHSEELIKAVVAQRSVKSREEIDEIGKAHSITWEMHTTAMRMVKAGVTEQEVTGVLTGIAVKHGGFISFPIILSKNGNILHNHYHGNTFADGDLMLVDCGAETAMGYAADITRTTPVSGKFSPRQRDIYEIVLKAEKDAIDMVAPGVLNRDIHLQAASVIADGLKGLGLLKGSTQDLVSEGVHALFFPHGLGHMMGLDVHDMEGLGEDYVGYTDAIQRSDQFGLAHLRLGKALETGNVLTIEPGLYFIPELIDKWRSEQKFTDFIEYAKLENYYNFGGVRIEDDIEVTDNGHNVIGERSIPKEIAEIEDMHQQGM
jgi:Xaa-Pro aminopeptidase